MTKMKAVVVPSAGAPFRVEEREIPRPRRGEVLIKVHACGICHSDVFTKDGTWPGVQYPRVPGHEVSGVIAELGSDVQGWSEGQRVGVGWFGGNCGYCEACRHGDLVLCVTGKISGLSFDGGYAEYMVAPANALAALPKELADADAAPVLCAGVTTFNPLRHSSARPGDLVAVLGIGGLGHLGLQYAAKMGFNPVAIARGSDKEGLARELGARHYVDSASQDVAEALSALGGAKVILATVTHGGAMSAALGGLARNGQLFVLGAADRPIQVPAALVITKRAALIGWPSGMAVDSEETLAFSAQSGVRPRIEKFPLERAAEAYERMLSGKARFRAVLTMNE